MAGPQQPNARDPKKPSEDTASVNYNAAFADLQSTLTALGHQKLEVNGLGQQPTLEEYYPELVRETAFNATAAKNAPESTTRVLFWYHPDYLGNVDLVTERDGKTYEFFTYNPWGEEMHQYNANTFSFSSPYRFNSKEKDAETGLHYYGARYYQSKLSMWLSVDPLAHETLEPYIFTGNNPVMFVDPDGRDFYLTGPNQKKAISQLKDALSTYGISIEHDNETGKVDYSLDSSNKREELPESIQSLLNAMDDPSLKVTIIADNSEERTNELTGEQYGSYVGSHLGSRYDRKNGVASSTNSYRPERGGSAEEKGGYKSGIFILHEATEASIIANITKKKKFNGYQEGFRFKQAHKQATPHPEVLVQSAYEIGSYGEKYQVKTTLIKQNKTGKWVSF